MTFGLFLYTISLPRNQARQDIETNIKKERTPPNTEFNLVEFLIPKEGKGVQKSINDIYFIKFELLIN